MIFHVTVNLEQALLRLRHDNKIVKVWADAICINQADAIEKSQQVQLMKAIYQSAESAFIWLGPAAEGSNAGMDALQEVGRAAYDTGALGYRPAELVDPAKANFRQKEIRTALQTLAARVGFQFMTVDVSSVTERSWFYRTWVLQEIALPPKVEFGCGLKTISFPHFASAMVFLGIYQMHISNTLTAEDFLDPVRGPQIRAYLERSVGRGIGTMIGARRRYQQQTQAPETLIQLLIRANVVNSAVRKLESTFAQDRVFGLLGIASDAEQLGIIPDYRKSCLEVYVEAALAMLSRGQVDLLSLCQFPKQQPHLPTWVPDWTGFIQAPCGSCAWDNPPLFRACGGTAASVMASDDARVIVVKCAKFDSIYKVGSRWIPGLEEFNWEEATVLFTEVEQFCDTAMNQWLQTNTQSHPDFWNEAVWRIPCGDQFYVDMGTRIRATRTALEGYDLVKEAIVDVPGRFGRQGGDSFGHYQNCMMNQHKRRPFISTRGYVGLAPAHSKPGDIICIVLGASVPYVLRSEDCGRYQLVGEAYVHGIMDGEFMDTNPPVEMLRFC